MGDRVPLHEYDSPNHERYSGRHHNEYDGRRDRTHEDHDRRSNQSREEYDSRSSRYPEDSDVRHRTPSYNEGDTAVRFSEPKKPAKSMLNCFKDSRRIDYVLIYKDKSVSESLSADDRKQLEMKLDFRERFRKALAEESIEIQLERSNDLIFWKLHTPFDRLCKEAASVNLEMPLKGCEIYDESPPNCLTGFEEKYLETDNEVDFVSAPFQYDKRQIFEGVESPNTFFRPAHRSLLTHHILINIDVRKLDQEAKDEDPLARKGLPWMLHKGVFSDWLVLHDESAKDPAEREELAEKLAASGQNKDDASVKEDMEAMMEEKELLMPDTRRELNKTWASFRIKYQPLWKIRNYFGEKIALYFAWSGTLITSLWIPTIFGLVIFFYGLGLSISHRANERSAINNTIVGNSTEESESDLIRRVKEAAENSLAVIKEAFDNDVTPFFALVICLWGTVFLEVWKRKNATLAYEWDVDGYEDMEPDRPAFYGTQQKPDPVTLEPQWFYPLKRQLLKFAISASVLICMVLMVFISAAAVILYRVFMTVDYCTKVDSNTCLLISTVAASILNAVSILILGRVYDKLAVVLTNWENHRTQTQYDDALILKLFAFQFANSYTSLFYIAFFRKDDWPGGMFGMGERYQDGCTGSCMSMLSLQVLVLMLMKPLPKFLKDVVLSWVLRKWRKRKWFRKAVQIEPQENGKVIMSSFVERERLKSELGDFTLGEYTEKIIVYGFLMLFAASFPLAPLIALLVNLFDIRVDAGRMLWLNRRPLSVIAQDIGMWYNILQFLNIAGVISNSFLIAFTSSWGSKYTLVEKLWIVVIFEHVVFAVKFFLALAIPDVPRPVRLSQKREKYQVGRILELATKTQFTDEGKEFK